MDMKRSRLVYAAIIAGVIVAGLGSRSEWASCLPAFLATYAGDTLWALLVFLCLGFVFTTQSSLRLALAALVISFSVEFSQLYQAEWIEAIRATRAGELLLGAGFKSSDLLCYTAGILMGVTGERLAVWYRKRERP
jgi:hypothetical protein